MPKAITINIKDLMASARSKVYPVADYSITQRCLPLYCRREGRV